MINSTEAKKRSTLHSSTFGDRLRLFNGIGPGFDFMRVALAVGVVAAHAPTNVWGLKADVTQISTLWVLFIVILPMFFGLSGFLVAASAQRLDLRNFLVNRGLRIVPALFVEIVLSALILGPIVTEFPIYKYFAAKEFFAYLENIVGLIHYRLPGVFTSNPTPDVVNGSLWTVPHEILCYVILAATIFLGMANSWKWLVSTACLFTAMAALAAFLLNQFSYFGFDPRLFYIFFHDDLGAPLVPSFLIGAAIYVLRDRIPHNGIFAFSAFILIGVIGIFVGPATWSNPFFASLISALAIYIVLYIGLIKMPKIPLYNRGDYSYGIYLYHFPIQQTLIYVYPDMGSSLLMFILSFSFSTAFAMTSWHLVEKPVLKLRRTFSYVHSSPQGASAKTPYKI